MPAIAPPLRSDTAPQRVIHRGLHGERRRMVRLLIEAAEDDEAASPPTDTPNPSRKLANQIAACCRHPWSLVSGDGARVAVSLGRCNQRVCPLCRKHRAEQAEARVHAHLRDIDSARLLTLTVRSTAAPLQQQITDLYAAFRRLRRREAWKKHVLGGVAVLEVTWSQKLQMWHPHLHCVIDGCFWDQRQIVREWEAVVGDHAGVDIRLVTSRAQIAKYVAKYVTKSATPADAPNRELVEWCHALRGTRTLLTFGSVCRRRAGKAVMVDAASEVPPTSTEKTQWERVCHMGALMEAALGGSRRAVRLLAAWRLVTRKDRTWEPRPGAVSHRNHRHARLVERLRAWAATGVDHRPRDTPPTSPPPPIQPEQFDLFGETPRTTRWSITPDAAA